MWVNYGGGEQRESKEGFDTEPVLFRIVLLPVSTEYNLSFILFLSGAQKKIYPRNERKQLYTPNYIGNSSLNRRINSVDNVSRWSANCPFFAQNFVWVEWASQPNSDILLHPSHERKQLHTPNEVKRSGLNRRIKSVDNVSRRPANCPFFRAKAGHIESTTAL